MPSLYHYIVPSLKKTASSEYQMGNHPSPNYEKMLKDALKKQGISAQIIDSDDPTLNYMNKPSEPEEAYSCILVTDKPIPDDIMNTLRNKWDFAVERNTTCYKFSKEAKTLNAKVLEKIIKALNKKSLGYVQDGRYLYFEFEKPLTDRQKKQIANAGGIVEPALTLP